jgi:hypothetical protein
MFYTGMNARWLNRAFFSQGSVKGTVFTETCAYAYETGSFTPPTPRISETKYKAMFFTEMIEKE